MELAGNWDTYLPSECSVRRGIWDGCIVLGSLLDQLQMNADPVNKHEQSKILGAEDEVSSH
jgi:hypothetical protein